MSRKMLIDGEMGSVEEGKQYDFDLFVIGAGSGGVRASRTSAAFGAKVAICELPFHPISSDEDGGVGGTCVIRGCVPKKILVYGSQFRCEFEDARNFGWELPEQIDFNWKKLLHNKVEDVQDKVQDLLKRIEAGEAVDDTAIADLSKRKLIEKQTLRGYTLAKGPKYVSKRKKAATDLTRENLQRSWLLHLMRP